MPDDRREEALELIHYHAWSGWYDATESFNIIDEEVFECDGENDAWLRKTIRAEFRKKSEAEKGWPKVTSFDRLDAVFPALEEQGILTRHRCGLTIQDGAYVVDTLSKEAGGKKSGYVGCCFYHLQDMESAMGTALGLYLAFGSYPPSKKGAVKVGQVIREAFEAAGFTVDWDGTADTRLLLKGFQWQRRSPKAKK